MECCAFVSLWSRIDAMLACTELSEVLCCPISYFNAHQPVRRGFCDILGYNIGVKLHFETAGRGLADVHIEEYNGTSMTSRWCGGWGSHVRLVRATSSWWL